MAVNGVSILPSFEVQKEIAYTSLGSSFSAFNPLLNSSLHIVFSNLTNEMVDFSMDGTNVFISLNAGSQYVIDLNANRSNNLLNFRAGTVFYAKYRSSAPTQGFVAVSSIYFL